MEKWVVILLFLMTIFAQTTSYPFNLEWLLIDSGTDQEMYNTDSPWQGDHYFIRTGKTKLIDPTIDVPSQMNTLRYFPKGKKNCFKLPLNSQYKFLFRAGFYYGNYDGLSMPPTFDLLLGGKLWVTVDTSLSEEPIYHEVVYAPKGSSISVCLVQTRDGEIPFISSLEATFLYQTYGDSVYEMMGNNTALQLVSRTNFGGSHEIIGPGSDASGCEENLNRVWKPNSMPDHLNMYFDLQGCVGDSCVNRPPDSIMKTAIAPPNPTAPIFVPVDFATNDSQNAYFVFYFLFNQSQSQNKTSNFEIHIDGVLKNGMAIKGDGSSYVASFYPVPVKGVANVMIFSVNNSVLPPILNAMEVFTATDLLQEPNGGFKLCCSFVFVLCLHMFSLVVLFV